MSSDRPQTAVRGHPGWLIYCPCGAVAYRVVKLVHDGDRRDAEFVEYPDGSRVHDGDLIGCRTCRQCFRTISLDGLSDPSFYTLDGRAEVSHER